MNLLGIVVTVVVIMNGQWITNIEEEKRNEGCLSEEVRK